MTTNYPPPPVPHRPMPHPPPARPAPRPMQRWAAGSQRTLTIGIGEARVALLQVVRTLSFASTSEQYSLLEAERGSKLRGLSLTRTRVPTGLRIQFAPAGDDGGCTVDIRVEDRWGSAGRSPTAVAVYADVFTEVLSAMDERLVRADPAAADGFGEWWRELPEHEASAGAAGAGGAARLESTLARRSSRVLDGPRSGPIAATAGAGVQNIVFVVPGDDTSVVAEFAPQTVDGMLTAGQLVASAPGAMPAGLVTHLRRIVLLLEERLDQHRQAVAGTRLEIELTTADKPVVAFLHQQAALREKLPVRLLFSCTTCRLERVVNPDFVRLRERNRRVRILQTSVGAVVGTSHISPFILVGRLAQLKKTDPDHVCARCQGTDADEKPITFCPRCGERLDGSVLRTCGKCALDLRTLLGESTLWREIEAPPPAPEPPSPAVWAPPTLPPGWYADPWTRFEVRYWDGAGWTPHVGTGGRTMLDAPVAGPEPSVGGPSVGEVPVPPPPADDVTHVRRPT